MNKIEDIIMLGINALEKDHKEDIRSMQNSIDEYICIASDLFEYIRCSGRINDAIKSVNKRTAEYIKAMNEEYE